MSKFKDLGLNEEIVKGITELGFENPTPIQENVIELLLNENRDLIGLAQTGTGKTAAFGLPILEKTDTFNKKVQTVILSPTRELCIQISKNLVQYAKYAKELKIVAVYGGESIQIQINALKRDPQIVVATPGRILDLLRRKKIDLSEIKNLVLDEADEMLNMGFKDDLDAILTETPKEKRTLLFSATMPKEVERIARKFLVNPYEITIGKKNESTDNVSHEYNLVRAENKYQALKRIIDINPGIYSIIFCRTRQDTKDVAHKLISDGYNAEALHGDLTQSARESVMYRFRMKNIQLLVATDVASRGLDVKNLSHVINYSLPDDLEAYTHRSGRTGRANEKGVSVSLVHLREKHKIRDIERMINKKFIQKEIPNADEICKKQFFNYVDRLENVEINEEKVEPLMESINKKLSWLTKEDIIKRLVSLEFNRLLDFYKNAPDLNVSERSRSERGERSERGRDRETRGRSRSDRSDRSERSERGPRKDRGEKRDRSNGKKLQGDTTRFFLNMGKNQEMNPGRILGLFNDAVGDKDINVGSIDVLPKFSFFEVNSKYASKVVEAFDRKFKSRGIKVEIANKK